VTAVPATDISAKTKRRAPRPDFVVLSRFVAVRRTLEFWANRSPGGPGNGLRIFAPKFRRIRTGHGGAIAAGRKEYAGPGQHQTLGGFVKRS
jgi:hypothetical protein